MITDIVKTSVPRDDVLNESDSSTYSDVLIMAYVSVQLPMRSAPT
jgi:hypothetical protein